MRLGMLYPGYAAEDDLPWLVDALFEDGSVVTDVVHTSVGEDAHRVDALLDLGRPERLAEGAATPPTSPSGRARAGASCTAWKVRADKSTSWPRSSGARPRARRWHSSRRCARSVRSRSRSPRPTPSP